MPFIGGNRRTLFGLIATVHEHCQFLRIVAKNRPYSLPKRKIVCSSMALAAEYISQGILRLTNLTNLEVKSIGAVMATALFTKDH